MAFTKNDQAVVLNKESLQYLANCIRLVHSLPDLLNDVLPSQTTTYSSYKISELLNTLNTDLQNYVNSAIGNLSHLKKEIVSTTPTDDTAEEDTIYLVQDASGGYEQYLKINGSVTSLGSTSAINNVYTKTESDSRYALLSTLNSLITAVGGLNDLTTTDKTSIVNAINELKTSVSALENKSTIETLTQAEYDQKVADGIIDNDVYYIISDDTENIDLDQFNIKTYTSVEQLGLTSGCTVEDIYLALPNNSYFECSVANSNTTSGYTEVLNTPTTDGLLSIRKNPNGGNRFSLEFKVCATGLLYPNELYIGTLKGNDGSGLTWSRVLTSSVADVELTNITYTDETNYTNKSSSDNHYYVTNGICYIRLYVGCITPTNSNSVVASGLPKPKNGSKYKTMGKWGDSGSDFMKCTVTSAGDLIFRYGTTGVSYIEDFSYPVA